MPRRCPNCPRPRWPRSTASRSPRRWTLQALKLDDSIDDILITLGKQYHIIRPVASKAGLFLYVVLDKSKSNLALARRKVQDIEQALSL